MGGLTSKAFLDARFQLAMDLYVDMSGHNPKTGSNPNLDSTLEKKTLLRERKGFNNYLKKHGVSFSSLTQVMCYMGFGSKVVFEKYPNLNIVDQIIQGLRRLSEKSNMEGKMSLLEERKAKPRDDVLFRLIRPFFLHRYCEGLLAMLGSRFCRDNWRWKWKMIENTLAVLYRYIPLGLSKSTNSLRLINFLEVVNATGQVGLQGQQIACDTIGILEQILQYEGKRRYYRNIGPLSQFQGREASLNEFCLHANFAYKERDCVQPERVFKDIVIFTSTGDVYDRFDSEFSYLVKGMDNVSFKADPPLSVIAAWEKRNEIYEQKLQGRGNPWSHASWDFKRTRKAKERCQPEVGGNACWRITDYLSGTINCSNINNLTNVYEKVSDKKNKIFSLLWLINRLNTASREIICVGKFNINPPLSHYFSEIKEHGMIDCLPVTIRIRLVFSSNVQGYNHFELVRKNFLLSSIYSPNQFYTPRICNYEKELEAERTKLIEEVSQGSSTNNQERLMLKDSSSNAHKRTCPKSHLLDPVPSFERGRKCGICKEVVEINDCIWFCKHCNWLSCDKCGMQNKFVWNRLKQKMPKKGYAINFNTAKRGQNYESKSKKSTNDLDLNERRKLQILQEMVKKKDQRVRDLELLIEKFRKSHSLVIPESLCDSPRENEEQRQENAVIKRSNEESRSLTFRKRSISKIRRGSYVMRDSTISDIFRGNIDELSEVFKMAHHEADATISFQQVSNSGSSDFESKEASVITKLEASGRTVCF